MFRVWAYFLISSTLLLLFLPLGVLSNLESKSGNHYATLGVPTHVDQNTIKKAYRDLAKQYHPDKPTGDTHKFQLVQEAYEVLSNPLTKRRYDVEQQRYHISHNQQNRRGGPHYSTGGKTFIFRKNGQSFMFTESDLFGQQQHEQRYYRNHHAASRMEGLWSFVGHLIVFGCIFYALRAVLPAEHGGNEEREGRETTSRKEDNAAEKKSEKSERQRMAAANAPHLREFESSLLRQRARRCCVFFPRHCDVLTEWQTLEQISVQFYRDRIDFCWVDLASDGDWQAFLACEYQDQPLAVVFSSAGAKASRFSSNYHRVDFETPLTPMNPLKEQMGRWIERIIEGVEDLPKVVSEPPKHRLKR